MRCFVVTVYPWDITLIFLIKARNVDSTNSGRIELDGWLVQGGLCAVACAVLFVYTTNMRVIASNYFRYNIDGHSENSS